VVLFSLEVCIGCKRETVTDELRSQSTIVRCACTRHRMAPPSSDPSIIQSEDSLHDFLQYGGNSNWADSTTVIATLMRMLRGRPTTSGKTFFRHSLSDTSMVALNSNERGGYGPRQGSALATLNRCVCNLHNSLAL
jgi:hypothetical protein